MKQLITLTSSLALSATLLTAHAQAPTSQAKPAPKKADKAAPYEGPKVVPNTKALGQKMVQKSKPTDMMVPPPTKKKP